MKNIFKKNQIIITALAIMIVIAGYLSFTNDDVPGEPDTLSTSNPDVEDVIGLDGLEVVQNANSDTENNTDNPDATITPDVGVTELTDEEDEDNEDDEDETEETGPANIGEDIRELGDISDDDILKVAIDVTDSGQLDLNDDAAPGEAVLVSTVIDQSYFISNKVDREQMRSSNRNTLLEMIENPSVDESLKKDYTNKLIELTEISEKEKATEILLGARGFDDALVVINEGKADVIINTPSLSDQQLAIIESVVKDKTDFQIEDITIVPVVTQE